MEWLSHNVGTVVSIAVVLVSVVATWVLYGADIKQLKRDNEKLNKELDEMSGKVQAHHSDTTVHIDPNRDRERFVDFKEQIFRRFDSMESKLENVMLHMPAPKL